MPDATPTKRITKTGRRPGNSTTEADILRTAGRLFAERGFDAVTIRAIAEVAGVDTAMVHYFFGTKDQLFLACVRQTFDPDEVVADLLAGGVDGLGERLVTFVLARVRHGPDRAAPVGLLRTAAARPAAARMLREFYAEHVFERLTTSLGVDQPRLRAALCSSQLFGMVFAERVLVLEPLTSAPDHVLVNVVGATLQRYLTRPLPAPDAEPALRSDPGS